MEGIICNTRGTSGFLVRQTRFQHHGQRRWLRLLNESELLCWFCYLNVMFAQSCFPRDFFFDTDCAKKKKKVLVVFPCFCCCRILRKNPSNVLSSRLLPPQLVPPSDTPTLSAPHMGTSVEEKTGEESRSSEASLDRLYRQKLVTVSLLVFFA